MFEAAELDRAVAKADYESEVAKLRLQLLDMQRRLEQHPFPLIVPSHHFVDRKLVVVPTSRGSASRPGSASAAPSGPDAIEQGSMTARVQAGAACEPAAVPALGSPTR